MFLSLEAWSQLGFPRGCYERCPCGGSVAAGMCCFCSHVAWLPGKSQHGAAELCLRLVGLLFFPCLYLCPQGLLEPAHPFEPRAPLAAQAGVPGQLARAGANWSDTKHLGNNREKKIKVFWLSPLRACCQLRGWGWALCSHHPHQFCPNLLGAALQVTSVSPSSASGQRWHHSAAARRWRSCTVPQVRHASPAFCLVPPSRVEALLHAVR